MRQQILKMKTSEANQIAIAAIEIQALDSNNFIEWKIDRSENRRTGAMTDLLEKLVVIGISRVSSLIASHPAHNP